MPPLVRPNYFADPYDLEAITDGTMLALEVMSRPPISRYIERCQTPSDDIATRDQIRQFCQSTAHAALHPAGTCRAGQDDMAVVDPHLKVHGMEGLRVADASIMPTLISGNPNAVCIMIGEKLADTIKRERSKAV